MCFDIYFFSLDNILSCLQATNIAAIRRVVPRPTCFNITTPVKAYPSLPYPIRCLPAIAAEGLLALQRLSS